MPKVSVIIPVFGVEKYIERCARSLFEQTLDDMEFIFVNDCTKDNSIEVLKSVINEYPNRKHQVKIFSQTKNMGVSRARERGVREAKGEYIGFCDSDDWVTLDMYKKMYERATSGKGFDFIKCGHYISDGLGFNKIKLVYTGSEDFSKDQVISWLLTYKHWNSIWDSICRTSIYHDNNIEFTDDNMLEDLFLATQLLSACKTFNVIQEPLYYYFSNPTSICHLNDSENIKKKAQQAYNNVVKIVDIINRNFGRKFDKEIIAIKSLPKHILVPAMTEYKNYQLWSSFFPEAKYLILISPFITRIIKLRFLLVSLYLYPIYSIIKSKFYHHE